MIDPEVTAGLSDEELDGLLTFMSTAFDSYVGWHDLDLYDAAQSMKSYFQIEIEELEAQAIEEIGLPAQEDLHELDEFQDGRGRE